MYLSVFGVKMLQFIYRRVGHYVNWFQNLYVNDAAEPTGPGPIPTDKRMEYSDSSNMVYSDGTPMAYSG